METSLAVTALTIKGGDEQAIFVACDLVGISDALMDTIKALMSAKYGKDFMVLGFCSAAGISGVVTAKQSLDYMMVLAVVLYSTCYKIRDLMTLKMAVFIPLAMMLVYAAITVAYTGIICHGIELTFILVQTILFFVKKRKKEKNEEIETKELV